MFQTIFTTVVSEMDITELTPAPVNLRIVFLYLVRTERCILFLHDSSFIVRGKTLKKTEKGVIVLAESIIPPQAAEHEI